MKKVMRYEDNQEYWDRRWAGAQKDADGFADLSIYPIKYAELVMKDPSQRSVEIGAGLGRVFKHYYYAGYDITGIERSETAVQQLQSEISDSRIFAGDVRNLPFDDGQFDVVLAFGLYHNLEEGFDQALAETGRILKPGGRFCISTRPNNFEMRFNEWYWRWKQRRESKNERKFHKWLAGEREFRLTLSQHGLHTQQMCRARNVSLLYRIPWLRGKSASEAERRSMGYRLNGLGRAIDKLLIASMPSQFCNVLIYIGVKGA